MTRTAPLWNKARAFMLGCDAQSVAAIRIGVEFQGNPRMFAQMVSKWHDDGLLQRVGFMPNPNPLGPRNIFMFKLTEAGIARVPYVRKTSAPKVKREVQPKEPKPEKKRKQQRYMPGKAIKLPPKQTGQRLVQGLPIVIPAHVKVQKLPGFTEDTRFKADPNAYGCGFSAVGIGRDVETGRAW